MILKLEIFFNLLFINISFFLNLWRLISVPRKNGNTDSKPCLGGTVWKLFHSLYFFLSFRWFYARIYLPKKKKFNNIYVKLFIHSSFSSQKMEWFDLKYNEYYLFKKKRIQSNILTLFNFALHNFFFDKFTISGLYRKLYITINWINCFYTKLDFFFYVSTRKYKRFHSVSVYINTVPEARNAKHWNDIWRCRIMQSLVSIFIHNVSDFKFRNCITSYYKLTSFESISKEGRGGEGKKKDAIKEVWSFLLVFLSQDIYIFAIYITVNNLSGNKNINRNQKTLIFSYSPFKENFDFSRSRRITTILFFTYKKYFSFVILNSNLNV